MAKSPTRKSTTRKTGAAKAQTPEKPASGQTPLLEWIAAGVGLVVLVLAIGFVASEAFAPDHSPATLVVQRLSVVETKAGYLVRIRVINQGGSPAAGAVVEGELAAGGKSETAQATFDFIADHSSREGGLFFENDPRRGGLTLRAKGYASP